MLTTPIIQELAPLQDLLQDPPLDSALDACQAQDGIPAPFLEISLLQVLRRKPEQLVLFAFQEPQELQVRFRSPIYDGAWALPEESLARLGAVSEEVQATITLRPSGQLSQALPSDAFDQISSQCLVAKA